MYGLRHHFLLNRSVTYLNHGSFGATPRPVFQAYQRWQRKLESQPVEFLGRNFVDLMKFARQFLAGYMGTEGDNLIYVTNVTEALNIVARSLDLKPGDEILSTDHEYGALDRTWKFLGREKGFKYINQPISIPMTTQNDFLDEIWSGVTSRTKAIFLSHITSPTALRFPLQEVIKRARNAGILTIIDGAHAPGQIPLDLNDLNADFYAGNLHKWLCAPKGAGFLFARPDVQPLLKPLIVSWGYESDTPGNSPFVDLFEWNGTRDIAAYLSVPEAIRYQKRNNWVKVRKSCHELICEVQETISSWFGLPPLSNPSWCEQMCSIQLPPKVDVIELKSKLYNDFRIEIPIINWNGLKLIRVSIQGYNTHRDVETLIRALKKLVK
jgi:isopenicillin-N epimerase